MIILVNTIVEARTIEHQTELTVLQLPTGRRDHPLSSQTPSGHFLIRVERHLERTAFRPRHAVTTAGLVAGGVLVTEGDQVYRYPVIVPQELSLWR